MTKKDLVQELREIANDQGDGIFTCEKLRMLHCNQKCGEGEMSCRFCQAESLRLIANRIAKEYDPKPEPDTVENVALDMLAAFYDVAVVLTYFKGKDTDTRVEEYRERLEALGVKFDD